MALASCNDWPLDGLHDMPPPIANSIWLRVIRLAEKGDWKGARKLARKLAPQGMMKGFEDRHCFDSSIASAAADLSRAEP